MLQEVELWKQDQVELRRLIRHELLDQNQETFILIHLLEVLEKESLQEVDLQIPLLGQLQMKTEMQVLADQQHLLKEMFHLKQNLPMGTELHLQALLQELSRQGQNPVSLELKPLQQLDLLPIDLVDQGLLNLLREWNRVDLKVALELNLLQQWDLITKDLANQELLNQLRELNRAVLKVDPELNLHLLLENLQKKVQEEEFLNLPKADNLVQR